MASKSRGRIFNIQRYCIHDGPGIRTTVFLQGCPLHCLWCHNPESQDFAPRVSFQSELCINCGRCAVLSPGKNCRRAPEKDCSGCGICVKECPAAALTLLGREVTPDDVMKTVLRDRFYYDQTGGGLTISGGEPCSQREFTAELLDMAAKERIHTAIETSGMSAPETVADLAHRCGLWLFDIKAAPDRYRELTGADYRIVRANLQYLSDHGCRIGLRVPLVSGANCEPALLEELKSLACLPGVEKIDLLPYHDMGRGKAVRCGKAEPDWKKFSAPSDELLTAWRTILENCLADASSRSGSIKVGNAHNAASGAAIGNVPGKSFPSAPDVRSSDVTLNMCSMKRIFT